MSSFNSNFNSTFFRLIMAYDIECYANIIAPPSLRRPEFNRVRYQSRYSLDELSFMGSFLRGLVFMGVLKHDFLYQFFSAIINNHNHSLVGLEKEPSARNQNLKELGLEEGASSVEIRQAYLRLVRIYHPDKNPSSAAADKFRLINAAYKALIAEPAATQSEAREAHLLLRDAPALLRDAPESNVTAVIPGL